MRHRTCIAVTTVALALVFSIITASAFCSAAEPSRLPVPDGAAVSKSRQLIRSAYEAEYKAAMRSRDPASLMAELEGSVGNTTDPVRQYALLCEAESLARQYNDLAQALAIIDKRARLFEEDGLKLQADMLQGLAGPKVSGDATLLNELMQTATQAAVAERFEIATDLAKAAVSIAKSIDRSQKAVPRGRPPEETTGPQLIKAAQELQTRLNDRKKAFNAYREASAIIDKQPDDPQANAAVGTYLCLIAQNWEKGLPHLAKSKIYWIGTLAAEEVALRKAMPPDPAKMFALAERWWNPSLTKETAGGRDAIRLHAASLYSEVLPHLKDPLERRVAETRGKPFEGRGVGQRRQANEVQAADEVFLSDLPEQNPVVGYGVFGKNGNMGYEDRKIIVGGKASPKGISMHPPSDGTAQVTYSVPDECTHFIGRAALGDDGMGGQSTAVTFRVMNERGDLLWESKPIDRTGAGEECHVHLRGAKSVTLAVVCPGPLHKAWAVWVDPRFVSAGGKPASLPAGDEVFLSDLQERNLDPPVEAGAGFSKHGKFASGEEFRVEETLCPKGILLSASSNDRRQVTYSVPPGTVRFRSNVGIHNNGTPSATAVIFKVLDEHGKELWVSDAVASGRAKKTCDIELGGTTAITLVTECPGSCWNANGIWVDPRYVR